MWFWLVINQSYLSKIDFLISGLLSLFIKQRAKANINQAYLSITYLVSFTGEFIFSSKSLPTRNIVQSYDKNGLNLLHGKWATYTTCYEK